MKEIEKTSGGADNDFIEGTIGLHAYHNLLWLIFL